MHNTKALSKVLPEIIILKYDVIAFIICQYSTSQITVTLKVLFLQHLPLTSSYFLTDALIKGKI